MPKISFRITKGANPYQPKALRVDMLLDGELPADELLNISAILYGGAAERSSFYLYTCSCGVSGCAGFHIPLEQERRGATVIWTIEDEKLAEVLGANVLEFDALEYDAERDRLLAELTTLEVQGFHADSVFHHDGPELLGKLAEYFLPYYHGQAAMTRAIEAASDPNEPGMIRFSWGAPVSRAGQPPEEEEFFALPAADAAAILLRLGESLLERDAPKVARLPRAAAVIRDFAASGDARAAEDAFSPMRIFLIEDDMDETGAPIFGRDEQGPFVRHP